MVSMNILLLLVPLTVLVVSIAIFGLLWAIRSGQFDDLEGPAYRILMDEDDPRLPQNHKKEVVDSDATVPKC